MGQVAVLSLTAAFNPTLVAASTLMMLLPRPLALMLGYLVGALMTSITAGLVIVNALDNSGAVSTTKRTLSPIADIALGAIALVVAYVLSTVLPRRQGRRIGSPAREKKDPRWKRAMSGGSARTTFVIGALLSLPGASYLAGLHQIHKLHYSTAGEVLAVVLFNVVMLALLEVPLLCFVVAPEWTPGAIERAKSSLAQRGPRLLVRGLAAIGVLLILKGAIGLLD